MGVLQFQSLSKSLLLKLIDTTVKRFHLMFLLHNFRPFLMKQMIFVPIKKRFPNICRVSKSKNRMNTTLEVVSWFVPSVSFGKSVWLDSQWHENTASGFLKLRDLEKNFTSSSLVLSDCVRCAFASLFSTTVASSLPETLVFEKNQSVLLAPEYTAVTPASYVIVLLRDPSQQCFLPDCNVSVSVSGCRITTWHPFFQIHPYLLWLDFHCHLP